MGYWKCYKTHRSVGYLLWCNCHRTHRSIGYCGAAVTELTEVLCRVKTEGNYPRYRSVGTLQNLSVKYFVSNTVLFFVYYFPKKSIATTRNCRLFAGCSALGLFGLLYTVT